MSHTSEPTSSRRLVVLQRGRGRIVPNRKNIPQAGRTGYFIPTESFSTRLCGRIMTAGWRPLEAVCTFKCSDGIVPLSLGVMGCFLLGNRKRSIARHGMLIG